MAYNEVMKCLAVDTTKSKSTLKDERVHGGLLLLNELLRVSDVKFEVRNQFFWNDFFIVDFFRIFVKI
jgi:hypothetical protein